MKTVIKAIFSVLFSYIFLLYMKIPINGMIIIGVGIAFYKIWMTKKDFDRIDDKLSYIAFSLLLSISIVLSKHIHPDECNPFATIDEVFIDKFSIVDLIGCLICLFVIVNILNWLIKKIQKLKFNKGELANAKKELKKKNQFMIFGLIFLSWMPYFLIYYPGLIYGDSMGSIYQTVYHLNLSNHHPVFYTIFIAICLKIGYIFSDINAGCAIYTLIQMLYISGLLTYIVSWMYNKGISKILCCFTVIFFAGTATFPQHAISMWKDPIFSITLVYYSLKLYDYIISDGKIEEKERLYWVKLTISMLIISLTRNNGIYILMLSFLSLVILTIKNIKLSKKIYFTHILSIVFIILLTGPGYDILGIQKDKVEFLCNECCWFGCKDRKACYEAVSRKNLGENREHHCTAPESEQGYCFSKAMQNPGFIGIEAIQNVYFPMGFSNFKIEGRGLGSALILEFLLYYMTKPQYQLHVREEIYLDNMLDLF